MERKKGLFVIAPFFRPSLGGAETYINELCEFFRHNNYYVYVYAYQPLYSFSSAMRKGEKKERLENMEIRRLSWIGNDFFHKFQKHPSIVFFYLMPYLFFHCFFWMLKNHRKIDVIDAEGLNAAFIARILKFIFRKKMTVSILALYNFVPGSLFSKIVCWTLSGADKIFVEKGKSKEELEGIGLPADKLVIFNQWVDQNRFKPANKEEMKSQLGWKDKFVVLFVGRAIPEKGANILLEASRSVSDDVTFAFISSIGLATEGIIKESKTMDNIIFVGEVNPLELHKYYQACDIFCLPSKYEEGVARVVPEAISCGAPMVASNMGSTPYVLEKSVARLIYPDAENFAKEINDLYANPGNLHQMAENCRSFAIENFGEKNIRLIYEAVDSI